MHMHRLILSLVVAGLFAKSAFAQQVPEQAPTPHDTVVVVLDASGSMNEDMPGSGTSKMEAAKAALLTVLGGLQQNTWVAVVVFSGRGSRNEIVFPLGPMNFEFLKRAVQPIGPNGGTPLGAFIKAGGDILLQERERQSKFNGSESYRLLVITDGEAEDAHLVERYVPDVLGRGINLDVIGVAMRQEHTLKKNAHTYRGADNPTALVQAMQAVFAEVGAGTDPRDQKASADAYAAIAELAPEMAQAMLAGLSPNQQNQPIGERPRPKRGVNPPPPSPAPNWDSARGAGAPGVVSTPQPEGCSPSRVGTTAGWAAFLTLFTLAGLLVVAHRIE